MTASGGPFTLPFTVPGSPSEPGVEAPRRGPAYGTRGAIATEHQASALAGLRVLESGGNAIDAAIAVSAVNVVVKPHYTHLGGDAFALIWHRETDKVECLNAGGRAPIAATPDAFADGVPMRGPRASTVPGLVDAWVELHGRHGSRPLAQLLAPAIALAEDGFPVSQRLAGAMALLASDESLAFDSTRALFLSNGAPYRPGELFRQPEFAQTLRDIAERGRNGFYAGRAGQAIASAMRDAGGLIDEDDLAQRTAHWHEPLTTTYRGCTVFEQALPSQGMVLLESLNIIESFPLREWGSSSANSIHAMYEATRLAFADLRRHCGDPEHVDVPVERLLSKEHGALRAKEIDMSRARQPAARVVGGDTTSFVVADGETAVAFIQSVFAPWGSGFSVPSTGILMNNRMNGFSLDPSSPNCLAPGKRTLHTLNNYIVVRDGRLVLAGGTPGGDYQVQTNLQTLVAAIDWQLDIQSAIDAPRWVHAGRGRLAAERRFPDDTLIELEQRGHEVHRLAAWDGTVQRANVIAQTESGWAAAADARGAGVALAL